MSDKHGKHDSGKTSDNPRSGSGGRHSVREPAVVRPPAEQARVIREIRDSKP